jgi:hypothetical protein
MSKSIYIDVVLHHHLSFFLIHFTQTRSHTCYSYVFACMDSLSLHDVFFSLGSSEDEIDWRKLATAGDVIWILTFCLARSLLLLLLLSFSIIIWHTHTKKLYAHLFIHTEDTMKISGRDQCVSAVIFIVVRYQSA